MEHILDTPDFARTLAQLSEETGTPVSLLRDEARSDLKEMAVKPGGLSVAGWDMFTRWLSRAYKVDYQPADVEKLRQLNETSGLIFLPNHRSYLDPLVLRWALERHGFPPNNTLGGSNLALYRPLQERWPELQVQASGGVSSLDDIRAVKALGVSGAILGRALLEGKFTLGEALAC